MLLRWAPAFSKSLMCHLRKGEDLREELEVGFQLACIVFCSVHDKVLLRLPHVDARGNISGVPSMRRWCLLWRPGEHTHAAAAPLAAPQGILLPHEIDGVLRAQHRPNYVLQVLLPHRAGGAGWVQQAGAALHSTCRPPRPLNGLNALSTLA